MKLRILSILLCTLTGLAGLAGCSGGTDPSSGEAAQSPAPDISAGSGTDAWEPAASAASGEKVSVELLNGKPENAAVMEELIALFNSENDDVEVIMTSVPDAKKVLLTRVATDDVPDIAGIFPISQQDQIMQREGVFLDITGADCLSLVSDTVVELCQFDGRNYCLPITTNATALFYNTEIFARYNLEVPTTDEELWAVCDALKENGVQAFSFNDKNTASLQQQFERMVACCVDQEIPETCIKVAAGEHSFAADDNMRKFCRFLIRMREYGPADPLGMDTTQAREEFANGKAAMFIDGSWCAGEFVTINPGCPFSSAAPPMISVDKQVTAGNVDTALAISAKTPKADQCMRFLEFFARQDVAQKYCEADLNPNIVKSVNYNVEQLKPINDMISAGAYIPSPSAIWDASLRSEIQIELQTMLIDKDIDRFLGRFDELVKENYNSK